jgi:dolichyl-phosphate-mannose-protein mannosyltransferase
VARSTAAPEPTPFHVKLSPAPAKASLNAPCRPTRVELLFVVALFLAGTGLRCAYPSRMAVEHFDEGVYASNIWFGAEDGYRYPAQHLYAPPLLPALIETVFLFFGPSNFGAMLPSLVAGCLTIPLVWWVGREWFGPAAGIASATLATLSDPHIVFTRTALTDVLLCFWLLLAVYFVWRALTKGGGWPTVAAGFFTALAWWTKYNGWLPLAIGGAGLVPWCLLSRPKHPQLTGSLVRWLAIAAIAVAAWSPWLWSLQKTGGYGAVAANHRGYLVGFAGWFGACQTQFSSLTQLEGTAGQHAPLAALLIVSGWMILGSRCFTWNTLAGSFGFWLAISLLSGLSAVLHGWGLTACIGAAGLVAAILCSPGIKQAEAGDGARLALWMLAAWFVGLALTTPLYTPYPRLTLPWTMAGWMAGGLGVSLLVSFLGQCIPFKKPRHSPQTSDADTEPRYLPVPRRVLLVAMPCFALAGMYILESSFYRQGCPGWEPRTTVREESAKLLAECQSRGPDDRSENDPFVIYTFAEPALLFQLRLGGAELVGPVSSLGVAEANSPAPQIKSFVAIGEQAIRTAGFETEFASAANRLTPISDRCLDPSRVVWLDSRGWMPPRGERAGNSVPCRYRIALYRIR